MKTEREMFEEWIKNEDPFVGSDDNPDCILAKKYMWNAWQASASREGYKLVPIEATDSQWAAGIDAYTQAMDGQDILSASAFFDIYKAMIGAADE